MKKMVSIIRPFLPRWEIQTFENGLNIQNYSIEANLKDFSRAVLSKAKKENIEELDLIGTSQFTKKIKEIILKENAEKYNNLKLQINLL